MIKIKKMTHLNKYGVVSTSYKWVRVQDIITFEEVIHFGIPCLEILLSYKDDTPDTIYSNSYNGDILAAIKDF